MFSPRCLTHYSGASDSNTQDLLPILDNFGGGGCWRTFGGTLMGIFAWHLEDFVDGDDVNMGSQGSIG